MVKIGSFKLAPYKNRVNMSISDLFSLELYPFTLNNTLFKLLYYNSSSSYTFTQFDCLKETFCT